MAKTPHILLIVMDTVRQKHLSCYGYHRATTPGIDALARNGVIFSDAITTSSWTLPTHASILTGMYSSKHGAHNQHQRLDEKLKTLPEVLLERDYQTAAFSNNPYVSASMGLARGFETFAQLWLTEGISKYFTQAKKLLLKALKKHDKGAREINKTVYKWLSEKAAQRRPTFVLINYLEAHLEYFPPRPYQKLYLPPGFKSRDIRRINQDPVQYIGRKVEMKDSDFAVLTALYDAELTYLDSKIDELVREYDRLGLLRDTLIIITSDHGDNIGESGFMGHEFSLSESILRIPMIIHYPPLFPAGTQIDHPVQLVDIMPTILDIIGKKNGTEFQGRSLTPQNWDALTDRYTISELFHPNEEIVQKRYSHLDLDQFLCDWKAIRHSGYKYLWSSRGNHRLYNIADDPAERTNLAERESVIAKNMMDKLDQWKNSFEAYAVESGPEDLDQRTIERLKKLGYID